MHPLRLPLLEVIATYVYYLLTKSYLLTTFRHTLAVPKVLLTPRILQNDTTTKLTLLCEGVLVVAFHLHNFTHQNIDLKDV